MNSPITRNMVATRDALNALGFDPALAPVRARALQPEKPPFVELTGLSLVGADFTDLDLKFAVFDRCDLSSARFDNCNLFKAKFTECVLYNASFDKAVLVDVVFRGSMLFGIRFQEAEIYGTGDRGLTDMLSREFFDSARQHLAYRGTAGQSKWHSSLISDENMEWPSAIPNHVSACGTSTSSDGQRVIGLRRGEVIELQKLHSRGLRDRWRARKRHPEENFARPPGDAWPEDSTGMMLRSYRHCLERTGRPYPASEARFWEKAYLTASKWRILQSKIIQADPEGVCDRWRMICGALPAMIAKSLLHPSDLRRKLLYGRTLTARGASRPVHRQVGIRADPHASNLGGSAKEPLKQGTDQGDGEAPEPARAISLAVRYAAIGIASSCGHLLFLMLLGGVALFGFRYGAASGIAWVLSFLLVMSLITILCMVPTDVRSSSNEETWATEATDALRDIYRVSNEFAQHVLCGYGERPARAVAAYGAWVLLFGVIYWCNGTEFAVDRCTNFGNSDFGFGKAVYISVVTATTLGYGDISPDSIGMAQLVSLEVVGALLLMAILLASLTRKFIGR